MKWFVYFSADHENWLREYDSEAAAIEDINEEEARRVRLKIDPVSTTLIKGEEVELTIRRLELGSA